MKLTGKQKEMIARATKSNDYCVKGNRKTMDSLEAKGLAKSTSGFGFRHGAIIELTEAGKEIQNKLKGGN